MKKILLAGVVAASLGAYFLYRSGTRDGNGVIVDLRKTPLPEFVSSFRAERDKVLGEIQAEPQILTPEQARSRFTALQTIYADMKKIRQLYKNADRKHFNEAERGLREEEKKVRTSLTKTVSDSDAARQDLMKIIMNEPDEDVKRGLSKLIRMLDPKVREPLEIKFIESESPGDRKIGIEGLATIRTESSLSRLIQSVQKDPSPEVRQKAVQSIGVSANFAQGGQAEKGVQDKARTAIRKFATDESSPVRVAAYRVLTMQRQFSPQDQKLLEDRMKVETDPEAKRALELASKVIQSRKNMTEHASQNPRPRH
jgi:hypothetical protein